MSLDFPAYAPSEEHELLRQTVRDIADAKIAPRAAETDETGEFPQHSLDALVQNDLHAVHIPESYGGVEADARGISACVVEKSDPGVSFSAKERKLGIKGSPTRQVILEDVRIPADRMIGAEGTGFKTALATLDHTRITIAAQALGIAQGAL